jgi:hypothetical protein
MKKTLSKKKLANKAKVLEGHGLTCDDCGKQGSDVKHTTCAFEEELYGIVRKCKLCPKCEQDGIDDI